jgi:hypothetical protein
MNKKSILTAALLCMGTWCLGQQTATGIVYIDENKNGRKDRREQGLEGVQVSNGIDVVSTDKNGRYQLPIGEDNRIFVIKPAHYAVPVNENNLPIFYYNHKPKGSPNLKYAGVAPTGPLPETIDFGLTAQDESAPYSVLVFGDPQPKNLEDMQSFSKAIIEEVRGKVKSPFGIALGDLVNDVLTLHQDYIQEIAKIGIPMYQVMGNHDMNFDVKEDHLTDETFEANFGPANYSFNYGNAHFIVLDNILYPDPRDQSGYWGGFRKDQLDFVENDLKQVPKDKLIVLAVHIPLYDETFDADGTFRKEDRKRLFDLLKDYPNTINLSAHTHLQRHFYHDASNDWTRPTPHHEYNVGTTSGDWYSGELDAVGVPVSTMRDGTAKGYAFLNINDNQYSLDYKVAGKSSDYQINLFAPNVVAERRGRQASFYANFFMGHQTDTVLYRIDQGEWKPMQFSAAPDPAYVHAVGKYDLSDTLLSGNRPSPAQVSSHLWQASLPNNLPAGEHLIEVQVTDRYGRTHTAKRSYRIEAQK